jgi:hypothetical protein
MHQTINDLINGANSKLLSAIREYDEAIEAQGNDYNDETHRRFELASAIKWMNYRPGIMNAGLPQFYPSLT